MHINITSSETGNNKGSSSRLVAYLEKENRMAEAQDKHYKPKYWFNHVRDNIQPYEVRSGIDNNVAKLSKDDAKFFLVNISPSEKELLYLNEKFGKEGAKDYLKAYANEVMDAYAKNFKRDRVEGNRDLVYYAKLENNRYYTYKDLEVRKGKASRGDVKPGEQMHVQVIVSRKDASNTIKLSPLNNSKGTNAEHSKIVGQFDRVAFKQSAEQIFDRMFNYEREVKESFGYANAMKHGSYEQKAEFREKQRVQESGNLFQQSHSKGVLDVLLDGAAKNYGPPTVDDGRRRKKKKRPGQDYDQGQQLSR
ncbi:molybdopterin-guanine dinucleotide biosynthesis protein MobB [Mucilaginibacter rubeus]|uniref:Molybdopterin-guanine dinucleotide biosynthesis protein MobB n=1 Tax=Mucilaginibacter rubeus TaxID=2027860 RepID=A0AAE6MHM8_9SPHI|nr:MULTISPECIES: DUF5712 family protein [Mucilaginibacter]QEM03785.1 molybdopterin-guanine dinucleotide biosynthesis protein MobB [Mucilaginibacter rubeus]QEM16397.1 molybdopterin-guanine dinucleotide biosynthesis protein MobB [Mucilaginibacter gossypii]QTE40836.1 molybdopterin-guanine dinucleotide biosynthesis protein MobB [Mucilaginibacter rubeus]QTE47439.1 molybdopterin-guanine dinucleotide biosynthesis protein MobB [Mucilaginibacter rubeus]QTE58832.1 molybdopterin-guanine dinucleotide bios